MSTKTVEAETLMELIEKIAEATRDGYRVVSAQTNVRRGYHWNAMHTVVELSYEAKLEAATY